MATTEGRLKFHRLLNRPVRASEKVEEKAARQETAELIYAFLCFIVLRLLFLLQSMTASVVLLSL